MSYSFNGKKINDILESGEVAPLESSYEIEDLLVTIATLRKKKAFLEKLKKNRVQTIEQEIDKIAGQEETLKMVIEATLNKDGHKSLKFPGVGKVSCKAVSGKWVVKDEAALIKVLGQLSPQEYASLVTTEPRIEKGPLNKYLDMWDAVGKRPECVDREPGRTTLTLSLDGAAPDVEEALEPRRPDDRGLNDLEI